MKIGGVPRPYTAADQAAVIALWEACGLTRPWNDPVATIEGFVRGDHAMLLVAESAGGDITGSLAVGEDGYRGWLYSLAVDPSIRGSGVARRLIAAASDWLKARGVVKVQVIVRGDNEDVRGFYARAGFHATDKGLMQQWLTPPAENEFPAAESETLDVVVTHMQMTSVPKRPSFGQPRGALALLHAKAPPVSFYRYLYDAVGRKWLWSERRELRDDALEALLTGGDLSLRVLYVDGVPAGFAELDQSALARTGCVYLRHIGLLPSFIGRGYGRYLLTWVIDAAWQLEPTWIETSVRSLDHPHGVALLQQHGFTVVRQETQKIPDPRRSGLMAPRTPLPEQSLRAPPAGRPMPVANNVVTPLFPKK